MFLTGLALGTTPVAETIKSQPYTLSLVSFTWRGQESLGEALDDNCEVSTSLISQLYST